MQNIPNHSWRASAPILDDSTLPPDAVPLRPEGVRTHGGGDATPPIGTNVLAFHANWFGPRPGVVVGYRPEGDRVLCLVNVALCGETDKDALAWLRKRPEGNTLAVRYFVEHENTNVIATSCDGYAKALLAERPEDECVGSFTCPVTRHLLMLRQDLEIFKHKIVQVLAVVSAKVDSQPQQPGQPPATAEALTDADVGDENRSAAGNADETAKTLGITSEHTIGFERSGDSKPMNGES